MSDKERKGFLANLLGAKEATDIRDAAGKAAKLLDDAKVARKEGEAEAAPAEGTPGTDEIVAAIAQMLTNAGIPEDVVAKVAEAVKTALAPAAPETAPAEEVPAEVKSIIKSLGDLVGQQTEDNGLIAQAMVDIAGAVKEMVADNTKLRKEMEAVKAIVGDRPRQASKASETEIETNSALETKIKEGIDGEMSFLGVKISKPLASKENGNGKKG